MEDSNLMSLSCVVFVTLLLSSKYTCGERLEGEKNVCAWQSSRLDGYYTKCGLFGLKRCIKYREVYYHIYECCFLWTTVNPTDSECLVPVCPLGCDNGGTCVLPQICACRQGFYPPTCKPCGSLENCVQTQCTSDLDLKCATCVFTHTPTIRAFRPTEAGTCERVCSWRGDSKQCYPGICSDGTPDSCSCAPGYTGDNCLEITSTPDITYCLGFISDESGETSEMSCQDVSSTPRYTNIRAVKFRTDWRTQFEGPDGTGPSGATYPYPVYINAFNVGVIQAEVHWSIMRGSENQISSGIIECNTGISNENPDKGLRTCNEEGIISTTFNSGDVLTFSPKSTSGGNLEVKNYDDSGISYISEYKYYSGLTLTHTSGYTFDFDPPYHCLSSCPGTAVLDVGAAYTRQATISINFGGWSDDFSGVKAYQYEVYKFKSFGTGNTAVLDYKSEAAVATQTYSDVPDSPPIVDLTGSGAGMYCVVLIVYDDTSDNVLHSNHKTARRFLLYDDSSKVETSDHVDQQMVVTSAAENTTYLWITTLDQPVSLQWTKHFSNEFHRTNSLLNAIDPHSTDIDSEYEIQTGQPPSVRSMEAIPNVNGIVSYNMMHATDHDGGRSLTSPDYTWEKVINFQDERDTKSINRADGDSIRLWVQAFDVMGNSLTDDMLVHVDSSPPLLEKVDFIRNGEVFLGLHNTLDLFDMVIQFDTYDYHSGIKQITWVLQDMADGTKHGDGAVAVVRSMSANDPSCIAPACYCIQIDEECFQTTYLIELEQAKLDIPFGDHDYDYLFVITVVNNAMLQTTYRFQVTVDTSPPLPGHVFDAEPGNKDIDYQSSLTVHASWNGFFDRESGIKLYKYGIHTACLSEADFAEGSSPPVQIHTTYDTFTSQTMSGTGTYYTTVVAYNHALEPSHPVCTDGVTIDTTGPVVTSIHVSQAYVKPGLVSDGETVMYMDGEGFVYDLTTITQDCGATVVSDLSLYESHTFAEDLDPNQDNCSSYTAAGSTFYLAAENLFEVTWQGSDSESNIHEYMVALSSTETGNGDIMPFKNSHGRTHYITYNPNLVDYEEFYVNIKAINKAGVEGTQVFGPFIIRVSGPAFNGKLTLSYHKDDTDFLLASLGPDLYVSADISKTYLASVEYSLGEGSCSENLVSWTPVTNPANSLGCDNTWPPTCVLIDPHTQGFHLHHNTDYCLSLRLHSYNKLVTSTSVWYSHSKPKPYSGLLWEVDTSTEELVLKDIDFQNSTEALSLRFQSKATSSSDNLIFSVGIGSVPGQDDVKSFRTIQMSDIITMEGLTLNLHAKYYSSITVFDSDTNELSVVTSDGFTVLPVDTDLPGLVVYDGVRCSDEELIANETLGHHLGLTDLPSCGVDTDYQTYSTVMSVWWTYNASDAYVQYFTATVEKRIDSDPVMWEPLLSASMVGDLDGISVTGLYLEAGQTYRVTLQPCHPAGCFMPVSSNGVTILLTEPVARNIVTVTFRDNGMSLSVTWNSFMDPYFGIDFDIINQYTMAIFVRPDTNIGLEQITKWTHFQIGDYDIDALTNQLNTTYPLQWPLEASSCLLLGIRGYNRAMLYSTSYIEVIGCTVPDRYQLLVLDAVGDLRIDGSISDISLIPNEAWPKPDMEYTLSKSSLAAVWPTLKHGIMQWSVVHGDSVNRLAYKQDNQAHLTYLDFDCALSEVLACGNTSDRYVNIHNLGLEEGERYHVCIYAPETLIIHEKWNETLPEVSLCTNGVTVDSEPPLAGLVWVGHRQEHTHFQSDNLALVAHWNSFMDVEVNKKSAHHSGIKTYLLAIGSFSGGQDVLDFQDVGLTNVKIVTGLSLKNGGMYYVTINATDHVGLGTVVTSDPVTIDFTHPVVNRDNLQMSGDYLNAESSVEIFYSNGAFVDTESGIASYLWCIGTRPDLCDVLGRSPLTSPVLTVTADMAKFVDGQEYHVLIEAFNGASLSVSTTAATFVVDVSAPLPGFVHEVAGGSTLDIDYQVSSTELHLVWGDFSDPESHILEYRLSVGSCVNCTDVLDHVYVGLVQDYSLSHLPLSQGVEYFTQVRACNSAHLCTVVTSDGLLVDGSPPYLGQVADGLFGVDVDYQAKNNLVQAHLENIHDIQSELSIISWWAGTSAGDTDVFTEETTHSHTVLQRSLTAPLSEGTTVFVSVKVCNKAGLCSNRSSDGVTIDTTPPTMTGAVERTPTTGVIKAAFQVYRNSLSLQWLADDTGSPIVSTYVSVLPQDDAHLPLPSVKLTGNPESYTFPGLDLMDGDCYVAKVTVCNAAKLCSDMTSSELKVDSSPPTSGAFAVDTERTLELNRQRVDTMVYDNTKLTVTWLGFQDPHSDIQDYNIKIGTGFHNADIAEQVTSHQNSDSHEDEGFVVTENIPLSSPLTANQELYISITATNQAGLQSSVLHGLFQAIPSGGDTGILELERRCSALTCMGHCMCSPHGAHGCDITGSSCIDRNGQAGYATVTVYDVIPSAQSSALTDVDVIPSLHILEAQWTVAADTHMPVWFDWSVGVLSETPGSGLLDINRQPVWYEAGTQTEALFSMTTSKLKDAMTPHLTYVFYVKAWYDYHSYAIYQSDGVQVDSTAPELSDTYTVIEVEKILSSADVDFIASAMEVTVKWANVFLESQSGMKSFEVMLYSNKMLAVIDSQQVAGDVEEFSFTGLSLTQGEHYVSQVVGCNQAGLCTEATSDGFVLDTTPPQSGSVLDGNGFQDLEYSSTGVSASWHGFYDDESFIDHYIWCYSIDNSEIECTNVGLYQQWTSTLPENTENGVLVQCSVSAVNGAGLSSISVQSNGYILDTTVPVNSHHFTFGDNIVLNHDFTSGTNDWEVTADLIKQDIDSVLCIINGYFKQTLSTMASNKYRLKFDAFSASESSFAATLGYFQFGMKERHTISAVDVDDNLHLRQNVFFITAHKSNSSLEFGTMTDGYLCVGHIQLEHISEGAREIIPNDHPKSNFTGSIHVHVIASEMGTTLVLNWDFTDPEEPILDYMIAIGTVQGGIQLQDYKSVGTSTSSTTSALKVQHGTTLYCTVVATNAAGLSLVVHSDPIIVDLTPPVIEVFMVNDGNPILSTTDLNIEWLSLDPESGVESCDFSAENHNVTELTNLHLSSGGLIVVSLSNIQNGDTIWCTLMCKSYRGLSSNTIVGPLKYVTKAANTDNAHVYVIPTSATYYSVQDNILPSADMLWFRWDGIVDPAGIESCKVTVSDGSNDVIEAVSLGINQHTVAVVANSSSVLQDNSAYTLQVTCINKGAFVSDPVVTQFQLDLNLPVYTGESLGVFWTSDTTVQLNWSGLFTASTSLIYQVILGTSPGGIDVLSWLETKDTKLEVTDISSSFTHYLSLSAIGQNGLFITRNFVIKY